MTALQLTDLETKAIVIDSEFDDVHYAIDRQGKGMWLIHKNHIIPIDAKNAYKFLDEAMTIWQMYGNKWRG